MEPFNVNQFFKQNPGAIGAYAPTPKAQDKKKPWWTAAISELGGAGGAAGGAAIGTALLPGIGTLAGAIAGGFLGGTGGRVAENKVRDNRIGLGDALKEGTLAGALSALGPATQLAKGAKAARGVATVAGGVDDVIKAPAKLGFIEGAGRNLKAGGMGIGQGARLNGEKIGAAKSDDVGKLLTELKIRPGSPEGVQRQLEGRIGNLGKILDARYARNASKLSPQELGALQERVLTKVVSHPDIQLAKGGENAVLKQLQKLGNNPTTDDLWKFTKEIENKGINFKAGADAKLVDREAVNRIFRDEIRSTLNDKIPGLKETNMLYSRAKEADLLTRSASTDSGAMGGIAGKVMNLSPVKAAQSKVGAGAESLGRLTAGTGGPVSQVTNMARNQAPASLFRGLSGAGQTEESQAQDEEFGQGLRASELSQMALENDPTLGMQEDASMVQQGDMAQQPLEQDLFSREKLLEAVNNDPKNATKYISLYNALKTEGGAGGGPNIGKVSAQQYQLSQQGLNSLNKFSQLLQQDPSLVAKSNTPGRSLPGVGGYISKASGLNQFDTLGFAAISSLLRAQSGAAVPDSEVRSYMKNYLPRAGDSPADVQQKLETLRYAFQTVMSGAGGQQSGYSAPSSLEDALMGAY